MLKLLVTVVLLLINTEYISSVLFSTETSPTLPNNDISTNNPSSAEMDNSYVSKIRIEKTKNEEKKKHLVTKKEPKIYPKTETEKHGGEIQTVDVIVFVAIGIFFFFIVVFLFLGSKGCVIKSMNGRKGIPRGSQYIPSSQGARGTPSPQPPPAMDKTSNRIFKIT